MYVFMWKNWKVGSIHVRSYAGTAKLLWYVNTYHACIIFMYVCMYVYMYVCIWKIGQWARSMSDLCREFRPILVCKYVPRMNNLYVCMYLCGKLESV